MAQEALVKYANDNGAATSYNVMQVTKVTEQIVSGRLFRVDFLAVPTNCYTAPNGCNVINCHAEVLDTASHVSKRITKTKCIPNVYL